MARRKRRKRRLSQRRLILVLVIGAIIFAGLATYLLRRLPQDVEATMASAASLHKDGNYRDARRTYKRVLDWLRNDDDHTAKPRCFFELAQVEWDWATKGKDLAQTRRREKMQASVALMHAALRLKPEYLEARRRLADIFWGMVSRSGAAGSSTGSATSCPLSLTTTHLAQVGADGQKENMGGGMGRYRGAPRGCCGFGLGSRHANCVSCRSTMSLSVPLN